MSHSWVWSAVWVILIGFTFPVFWQGTCHMGMTIPTPRLEDTQGHKLPGHLNFTAAPCSGPSWALPDPSHQSPCAGLRDSRGERDGAAVTGGLGQPWKESGSDKPAHLPSPPHCDQRGLCGQGTHAPDIMSHVGPATWQAFTARKHQEFLTAGNSSANCQPGWWWQPLQSISIMDFGRGCETKSFLRGCQTLVSLLGAAKGWMGTMATRHPPPPGPPGPGHRWSARQVLTGVGANTQPAWPALMFCHCACHPGTEGLPSPAITSHRGKASGPVF